MADNFGDKVSEILEGLGEDEDFVQAVKDHIDYAALVKEVLQEEGVKRSMKKAAADTLKRIFEDEDESDGSFRAAVRDEIDFAALVREALADQSLRSVLVKAVADEIKGVAEEGDNWFSEALRAAVEAEVDIKAIAKGLLKEDPGLRKKLVEQVTELVAEELDRLDSTEVGLLESVDFAAEAKALFDARDPKVMAAIAGFIVRDFESATGLDQEERAAVWEALGVKTVVDRVLSEDKIRVRMEKKLRDQVEAEVSNIGKARSEAIAKAVMESPTFASVVDRLVSDMGSGRVQEFARSVVERALRESKDFQALIFAKVQESVAGKVAAQIVEGAFGR
jgi:hypothetical protein